MVLSAPMVFHPGLVEFADPVSLEEFHRGFHDSADRRGANVSPEGNGWKLGADVGFSATTNLKLSFAFSVLFDPIGL